MWEQALDDSPSTVADALNGEKSPIQVNQKLMHDIQVIVSRLVAKAPQLIDNLTTNGAEAWMHVRSKFDGGKVINRSQSGSWNHRCMGAGLQQNLGKTWGPKAWEDMTLSKENQVYHKVALQQEERASKELERKSRDATKEKQRKSKRSAKDNSTAARKSYSRHSGTVPDDVTEDVPAEHLKSLKESYYTSKVAINKQEIDDIERDTREQGECELWLSERKKRVTASMVGEICKMRKDTRRSKKVEVLLYSRFRGNIATQYGTQMEDVARQAYIKHQHNNGHPNLSSSKTGLVISADTPWLAASPDDRINDPDSSQPFGLAEYKNPYKVREMTLSEACEKCPSFCLSKQMDKTSGSFSYYLKQRHNYYYQIQCQLYCDRRDWCDFVLRTEKELHVERIHFNSTWWKQQLPKLKQFYFEALLPELASPRYGCGEIREQA